MSKGKLPKFGRKYALYQRRLSNVECPCSVFPENGIAVKAVSLGPRKTGEEGQAVKGKAGTGAAT